MQAEQTNGRVVHDAGLRRNGGRYRRGNGHTNILEGQCILEINRDHEGLEIQIVVGLNQRPYECRTAVYAVGDAAVGLAIDHQNLVRWTALIAGRKADKDDDDRRAQDQRQN